MDFVFYDSSSVECHSGHLCQGGYVFIGVYLFVCWQDYAKTTQPIFTKFGGKVAYTWAKEETTRFLAVIQTM